MSDLIKRKDAQRVILRECIYCENCKSVVERIEQIQPAESTDIIHCRDCKWWTDMERCELFRLHPAGDWFCGNARRKE